MRLAAWSFTVKVTMCQDPLSICLSSQASSYIELAGKALCSLVV